MEIMTTAVDRVWSTTVHLGSFYVGKGFTAERTPELILISPLSCGQKQIIEFPEINILIWKTEITLLGLLSTSGCVKIKWSDVKNNVIESAG